MDANKKKAKESISIEGMDQAMKGLVQVPKTELAEELTKEARQKRKKQRSTKKKP